MPRKPLMERLAEGIQRHEERTAELRHQMDQAQRQARAREQLQENRKQTARRKAQEHQKFVVGGATLAAVRDGLVSEDQVRAWVDRWATRDKDRATVGLAPLPKDQEPQHDTPEPSLPGEDR
jgi:TolA-binding protein